MQTFILHKNMEISAAILDRQRLGKQRVEGLQIAECLLERQTAWKNHPCVKMWKGYEPYLIFVYLLSILDEWEHNRKYKNYKCRDKWLRYASMIKNNPVLTPPFITDKFIKSHRVSLLKKNFEYYSAFFDQSKLDMSLEYVWK